MSTHIHIKGAREHNLKNISLTIPRDSLIVFTGLSGSGKSSLAFDTIYAEGQRRYIESLSSYARQFLGKLEKPDLDSITGLSPTIAIEQKTTHNNPRSTVGTVTEIYDFLRVIFARLGTPHCPISKKKLEAQSIDTMVNRIFKLLEREQQKSMRIQILAPIIKSQKGTFKDLFSELQQDGFVRVRINGKENHLEEIKPLTKNKRHNIDIIVDRIKLAPETPENRSRLTDSLEIALKYGNGMVLITYEKNKEWYEELFSSKLYSPISGENFPEITHRLFSFNSPEGACTDCLGLGFHLEFHPDLLIKDKQKTIREGIGEGLGWSEESWWFQQMIIALSEQLGFSIDDKWNDLSKKDFSTLFYGSNTQKLYYTWNSQNKTYSSTKEFEGFIHNLMRRYHDTSSNSMRTKMEQYMVDSICFTCKGSRLNKWGNHIFFKGKNIYEYTQMSIENILVFCKEIKLSQKESMIAKQALHEITSRLYFLDSVGLGYLSLDRIAGTLSGGELQRIRLATHIGSALVGVLYILDEPSIGLHQSDNAKLVQTLKKLKDIGNTVIVVEHDEDTIRSSDYIVDIGPRAGKDGGKLSFAGTYQELLKNGKSLTADYITGRKKIEVPKKRRKGNGNKITIKGARENNLKNIQVSFLLETFTTVTGLSGSGKSTLVNDILYKAVYKSLHHSQILPGKHKSIEGTENIDKVIDINQNPIGRTPRSNPATYTGLFTPIRDLFSELPTSKIKGYKPGRFSFNVPGGRCEECQGDGVKKIEMHFLNDIYVTCEVCQGKRYNKETLSVKYKGKNIYDILQMTVTEALEFFEAFTHIKRVLQSLYDVGLSYISLGQPATTLSGGEAQRIKLASELCKTSTGKTLYILDEPTTGLHFEDINQLLKVLHHFVDGGNTVVVIEHNLDVIKTADLIIDLGPCGGTKGGEIIATGTPEHIAKNIKSLTGKFLKKMLF